MSVRLTSRAEETLDALQQGCTQALAEAGEIAVNAIRTRMLSGYAQPVYESGALLESIACAIEGNALHVGTPLSYAPHVHDGTSRMPGRPFLHDGMMDAVGDIHAALADTLAEAIP